MIKLLLKNKSFLMLWLSSITGGFGNSITVTVLVYIIGSNSQNPLLISLVLFAQLVPMVIVGLFSGVVADRFAKYRIMIGSEWFQLLAVAAMITFINRPYVLIMLIFIQGIGAAFYQPAKFSYTAEIVDKENHPDAVGLTQASAQIINIIGPAVTGALLVFIHSSYLLLINVATFLFSTLFIMVSTRFANINKSPKIEGKIVKESILHSMKTGIKEIFHIAPLSFLLMLIVMIMFGAGIFNTTSRVLTLQVFEVSSFHYGMLVSISGLGAVIGSIIGPYMLKRMKPAKFLVGSSIFLGVWMMCILPVYLLKGESGLFLLYFWMMFIGLSNSFLNIPVSSLFMAITPSKILGRAASVLQMISNLGVITGLLLGGLLAVFFGSVSITAIAGIVMVVATLTATRMKGFKVLRTIQRVGQTTEQTQKKAVEG